MLAWVMNLGFAASASGTPPGGGGLPKNNPFLATAGSLMKKQ